MDRINSIIIQNIKGISEFKFNELLIPNKAIIFVAPNGFGKSSLALAFSKIRSQKLVLEKEEIHENNNKLIPLVEIGFENSGKFILNTKENTISKQLDVYVLNCQLYAKYTAKRMGKFTSVASEIAVKPIEIATVPPKKEFSYSISSIRKKLGKNNKIFDNIDYILGNERFVSQLRDSYNYYNKFKASVSIKKDLTSILEYIDSFDGSKETIKSIIDLIVINSKIRNDNLISFIEITSKKLMSCYSDSFCAKDFFLISMQMYFIFEENSYVLDKILNYYEFLSHKGIVEDLLKSCNTSWIEQIKPVVEKNKLVLKMPSAIEISNGERDILTFIAQLSRIRFQKNNKDLVIIIDELFDYLDEANLLVVQFILSNYINMLKKHTNIYPIILTHLNPYHFNNFTFSDQKIYFLDKRNRHTRNVNVEKIILLRNDKLIEKDMSLYFLHYNPSAKQLSTEFVSLGLDSSYSDSNVLKAESLSHLDYYCEGKKNYDPFLVGLGLRIFLEEKIYNMLPNDESKNYFIEENNGTRYKFEYAISLAVKVPESYFLLGILYNDILHIKKSQLNKVDIFHNNLQNKQIMDIIKSIYYGSKET